MKRETHVELGNAAVAGYLGAGRHDDDTQTMIVDLLADLRHWCDDAGVDWDVAMSKADYFYSTDDDEPDFAERSAR